MPPSLSDHSWETSSNFMESDYKPGPTWVTHNNLPISRSLSESCLHSSFCHVRLHIHRFWGLGHRHLQEHCLSTAPWLTCLSFKREGPCWPVPNPPSPSYLLSLPSYSWHWSQTSQPASLWHLGATFSPLLGLWKLFRLESCLSSV